MIEKCLLSEINSNEAGLFSLRVTLIIAQANVSLAALEIFGATILKGLECLR